MWRFLSMPYINTRSDTTPASSARQAAIVSLGANLPSAAGLPQQTLLQAMVRLRDLSCGAFRASSLYRTAPVGCPQDAPDFINAVVVLEVDSLTGPAALLRCLQRLEWGFGRVASATRNQSRVLDLDLVAVGEHQCRQPELILPHPRAHQRRFVLVPLAELLPDLVLPGQCVSVRKLLAALPQDQSCIRLTGL